MGQKDMCKWWESFRRPVLTVVETVALCHRAELRFRQRCNTIYQEGYPWRVNDGPIHI